MRIWSQIRDTVQYFFDKKYTKAVYRYIFHREMNWKHPRRFSEKLHVFKISPETEKLTRYADKYTVRGYVKSTIGEEYLVPLLGVWESVDEIDFDALPDQFVLKANHGSGWNIVCKDKSALDWPATKEQLRSWLKMSFYELNKERQYKNIKPLILAEKFLYEREGGLNEYKFHCFAGQPKYIRVQVGRETGIKKSFYDLDWKLAPFNVKRTPPTPLADIERPKHLAKMIELVERLVKPFPYVRADFYNIGGKIYFSELTFTPNNGQDQLEPESYDFAFGDMLDLEAWKRFPG